VKRSSTAITFKWIAPSNTGGVELTGFNVYQAVDNGAFAEISAAPSKLNPTILTHEAGSLTAGKSYRFKVSSTNSIGESDLNSEILVIAADLPEKPANPPTVTLITQTSISLLLVAIPSANNGGSPVTGYMVEIDDGLGGTFTQIHNSLTLILIVSNLKTGREYRIRYAGRNIVYDSNNMYECDSIHYSESINVLTAIAPTAPLNLFHDISQRYK
jgi:titin